MIPGNYIELIDDDAEGPQVSLVDIDLGQQAQAPPSVSFGCYSVLIM